MICLITVCKSSCGKVMFSQGCVKNSVQKEGVCVSGMCAWGTCMAGGSAWQGCAWGDMHCRGACMAGECAWWGGGGRRARQERRPLQRTVRILLECILVQLITFPFDDKFHLTQFVIHVFTRRTWNRTLRHMVFPVHFCCNNCNHCFGSRG